MSSSALKRQTISTQPLSKVARHVVLPSGATKTDWPKVETALAALGVQFDRWQVDSSKAALARRGADGPYAAGIGGVVVSIPRQVGKTFWVGALVFALCLVYPGALVIWTAHRVATAAETFNDMQSFAARRKVAPFIKQVFTGDGDEAVIFKNGSRILFGSRGTGFGRGFKKVKILILDEAQILTEKTMEDMVPATNQADNPLIFLMGTPPRPIDPGEVFKARRRDALSGDDEDVMYVEFSADRDADLDDRKQWAVANPSYPRRTPETSILRMKKLLGSDGSFRREALGIWDEDQAGSRAISAGEWSASGVSVAPVDGLRVFAVAFNIEGTALALAGGLKYDDGVHVELIDAADGDVAEGLGVLADWLAARWRSAAQIVLSGAAGAPVLAQLLRDRRVPDAVVKIANTVEYTTACSVTLDAVRASAAAAQSGDPLLFTHLASEGQAALDESVAISDKKLRGQSGAWGWSATTDDGDETPVEAVSLAYWMATTTKRRPGRKQRTVVMA